MNFAALWLSDVLKIRRFCHILSKKGRDARPPRRDTSPVEISTSPGLVATSPGLVFPLLRLPKTRPDGKLFNV
jgi:hypothetical protein